MRAPPLEREACPSSCPHEIQKILHKRHTFIPFSLSLRVSRHRLNSTAVNEKWLIIQRSNAFLITTIMCTTIWWQLMELAFNIGGYQYSKSDAYLGRILHPCICFQTEKVQYLKKRNKRSSLHMASNATHVPISSYGPFCPWNQMWWCRSLRTSYDVKVLCDVSRTLIRT